ncbi:MAG TPA: response regulator [Gemmatimonadaceae bacterium]|nr:response regulator [Gemmatimonadaceae bacterium]
MRRRILVVDDDRTMVDTLCDILELQGWETLRAYDGMAATGVVATQSVDVVLMDVRMPLMNGVEALQAMKASRPATRVVLMTAFAAADLLAQAERDGVLRIMRKPVDVSELIALLETAAAHDRPVLVVDDDPDALRTIRDLLGQRGFACITARSIPEALDQLSRSSPGAVLLDLRLNGVVASEELVAFRQVDPTALLILYSGHADALSQAVEGAPAGLVHAAFTKPLPIDGLLAAIERSA